MTLEKLLENSPEILKAVQEAISKANEGQEDKLKHVRYADLSEGGYVSKERFSSLESDLKGKDAELLKANGLIEELKKGTGKDEGLQKKIGEYEQEITALKAENLQIKTDNALKFALLSAGANADDIEYLVFKAKEKGEIKLSEDGKIKGEDDLVTGLKTQHPVIFASSDPNKDGNKKILENKLPSGSKDKTVTKDEFRKMGYADRLNLKKENPELFSQLSK